MTRLDKILKRDLLFIAVVCLLLSLVMEVVFLFLSQWTFKGVLLGNAGGCFASLFNYYLLCITVQKALAGKPEDAEKRMHASKSLRMVLQVLICVLFIAVFRTNAFATLIPLVFPRIALAFKPAWDRRTSSDPVPELSPDDPDKKEEMLD